MEFWVIINCAYMENYDHTIWETVKISSKSEQDQ